MLTPMAMSEFMTSLRASVGSRLLVLPAVSIFVFDDLGRILLARNAGQQQWHSIGGMVEPHEHPRAAGARELLEETGLTARDLVLVGVTGGPEYFIRYPNGDEVSCVTSVWRCRSDGALPIADGEEIEDVRWFDPSEFATSDLSAFLRAQLEDVGAQLFSQS